MAAGVFQLQMKGVAGQRHVPGGQQPHHGGKAPA